MTVPTRITRELVLIHDLHLREFVSLNDLNVTLSQLAEVVEDDVELDGGREYTLGLFLPFEGFESLHIDASPHSQISKLYRILSDHLYGVYSLGSLYTMKAVKFKRAGPFLLLSIDMRWKIGQWGF